MHDYHSWTVQDEAILQDLVPLVTLTEEERQALLALLPAAQAQAAALLEDFYGRLLAHANTAEYLARIDVSHLKMLSGEWFLDLFRGTYDVAYTRRRLTIGKTHVRIGLPVRYPLAMIAVVQEHGGQVIAQSSNPTLAFVAFQKVVALDVAIFNQAYEDAQLSHLSELVGGPRLARRLLAGED